MGQVFALVVWERSFHLHHVDQGLEGKQVKMMQPGEKEWKLNGFKNGTSVLSTCGLEAICFSAQGLGCSPL